jgi:hypothetical protein
MLSAEAMRLAAIEVLCPTGALYGDDVFPTLAGEKVFDSRSVAISDLATDRDYTPVIALHTRSATIERRSDAADETDTECLAVLEILAELAVITQDGDEAFADALAATDPNARIILSALVSQIRFLLEFSQAGKLFRDFILGIRRIEIDTFGVPDLGMRWQRVTIRVTAAIADDTFDMEDGGLPEPLASLARKLPPQSYAMEKLTAMVAHFAADPRPPLAGVTIAPAVGRDPIASTGEL